MKRRMMGLVALGIVAVLALAGCGGGSSSGGKETVVKLKSTMFEKKSVEVKAGTTIKWVNEDPVDHSVWEGVPDSGKHLFKSPDYSQGADYSYTFDKPGTYEIFCNTAGHHLIGMKMQVVVK